MAAFRKIIPLLDTAFDNGEAFEADYGRYKMQSYSPEQAVSYWMNQ